MTSRIVKLAAPAVAAALLLGACTSASPSPTATTTPAQTSTTTTATPTTSATTAATVPVPAAAKQRTEAGAIAFVKHFVDVFNQVSVAPQRGILGAFGLPGCKACVAYETEQDYLVSHNQHYAENPTTLGPVAPGAGTSLSQSEYVVDAAITQSGVPIVDATGKTLRHDQKRAGRYAFHLKWSDNAWRISAIKVIE